MKKGFTLVAAVALVLAVGLVWAPTASAQLPTLCQFAAGDFEKRGTLIDVDSSGGPTPGDQIDFEVLACNSGASACTTLMTDDFDAILTSTGLDPADYTVLPVPPRVGCPTDGSTICQKGRRGGPYTDIPGMGRCGQDCSAPSDQLAFQASPSDTIPPGECYRWLIRVQIEPTVDTTQCFCNQTEARKDFVGGIFISDDPNWTSLAPGLGCADSDTCPDPAGNCRTCLKVEADYNVSTSTKCIAGASSCSGPEPKTVPGTITYDFTIVNSGSAATPANMIFRDPLTFLSDTSAPCIDTTAAVTISPVVCSWPGCVPGDYVVTWDGSQLLSSPPFPPIPAGGRLTFSVTATIHPSANGNCTNNWSLLNGSPPVPETGLNTPVFNVGGSQVPLTVTKVPSVNPAPPGSTVDWTVTITNASTTQTANQVTFLDDVDANGCLTLVSCPATNPPLTLNCIPPGPVSPTNPFNLAPGASQQVVIRTTLGACQPTPCENLVQVTGANTNAVDATGSVNVQCAALDVTKSGSPDPVNPSSPLTWTITIRNPSTTDTARGVNFSDMLAPCNTLVSCSVSGAPVSCGGNPVTASAPFDIAPGATVTVTINTQTSSATGACQNSVTVTGSNISSSSASDTVQVQPGPSLNITKTPDSPTVSVGGTITWTIRIENVGSAAANGVTFTDDINANNCESLVGASCTATPPQATLSCVAPGPVTAGPFDIPAGQTQTFTIQATADAAGNCVNTAQVSSPSTGNLSRDGQVQIGAGGCGLLNGDLTALSPPTPAKSTLWATACAGSDDVLSNTLLATVNNLDTIDTLGGQPLRYYQLTCGCGQTIRITRSGTQVIISF